jgi:hypothetical protein
MILQIRLCLLLAHPRPEIRHYSTWRDAADLDGMPNRKLAVVSDRVLQLQLRPASSSHPAISFSQIDSVVNVMDDERSSLRYRTPILAVSIAANVQTWKVFCIFSKSISSRGTVRQPLTSHEDDVIDGAHLFKQLFKVRLDLLTAEVAGVAEDATFGKRVVGEDGLDAFVGFCFAGGGEEDGGAELDQALSYSYAEASCGANDQGFLVGKFGRETGCLRHCDFCKVDLGTRSESEDQFKWIIFA